MAPWRIEVWVGRFVFSLGNTVTGQRAKWFGASGLPFQGLRSNYISS
jgi:hypothetical protein